MAAISTHVKKLIAEVKALHEAYPQRRFTLDGRLVGDIGEVLAEQRYRLELNAGQTKHHDAVSASGRKVQIKTTMKDSLTFPADHTPQYYLGLKVNENGEMEEVYNGPARHIQTDLKDRKRPKNGLHSISVRKLRQLSALIPPHDRVEKR